MLNPIFGGMCRGENIQGGAHLKNQNYQNNNYNHRYPNGSHIYHDEIELYQGNSERNR